MKQKSESPASGKEKFLMQKDNIRARLLKYTRKAFHMLPQIDKPYILDIGCGSGISTLELARLSQGKVIGIDIDQSSLDRFTRQIRMIGLTGQVQTINCSMFDMHFLEGCFDIIWSEGSIYVIGFEGGLREWRRFLKPEGFMVVHDERGNVMEKLEQISNCGYELLDYFILDKEVWWKEYFAPLEKLTGEYKARHINNKEMLEEVRRAQGELDAFEKHPERNTSVCFVMKNAIETIRNT